MTNLISRLEKFTKGKTVLIFFVITMSVYFFMLFISIPAVMKYSDGLNILDMRPFGYSAEYAKKLLTNLGAKGRQLYLFFQIQIDMAYPLLYAFTYSIMTLFFLRKAFHNVDKLKFIVFLPLISGIFDYLENIGTVIMLTRFPSFSNTCTVINNAFTIIKSFSTMIFFAVLSVILIIALVKYVQKKIKW